MARKNPTELARSAREKREKLLERVDGMRDTDKIRLPAAVVRAVAHDMGLMADAVDDLGEDNKLLRDRLDGVPSVPSVER